MGAAGQHLGREPPHAGKDRIIEAQPPVAAEHGDRFGQVVQRRALDADQRVVAALEIEPFGDVLEQVDHAAFGIGRGDDSHRAPIR
jgi:hypothetical protein